MLGPSSMMYRCVATSKDGDPRHLLGHNLSVIGGRSRLWYSGAHRFLLPRPFQPEISPLPFVVNHSTVEETVMRLTQHARIRMQQRWIKREAVELAFTYGPSLCSGFRPQKSVMAGQNLGVDHTSPW